ncbi:S-adenosyl-L-methionine-dependent methyltransferase [Thelephora ganbajun]|uniref:S-adenosyl-L-methionine-dependent methyltransferase n=1 Tax=Thelephora ganbajun TaxID=370292 RepID=A0ACB6ZSI1_THEGA|nr:S-adenosyl-L-methionine-dependent methyltransferase [Thelephora ganbajun]
MNNARFESYYKTQSIIPEDQWDAFLNTLREPLPTTFRVAGSRQVARALSEVVRDTYIPNLTDLVFEGEAIPPPRQIPWYPDGLAWQFNVPKKVLRKHPEFKKFHSFLVYETEVGNISRQEAVSMLPPLFLQVIDMCAAPGSKTAQLLEALHADDDVNSSSIPSGIVIANDTDPKRTHLLIHQSSRLPSPSFMVMNLDASNMPNIKVPHEPPQGSNLRNLVFDRILCDVPCSGDGTMRKNVAIWKHWSPLDGNGLHSLQLRILKRAMRVLAKGGRIVYSTCSLNPVENEAVIAAALNDIPGFTLIDVSSLYPQLIRKPGMTYWKPPVDKELNFSDSYEGYLESLPEERRKTTKMVKTHWPPDNVDELYLDRCMRLYPHLQDTGGFFVAVLERVEFPSASERTHKEGKRTAEHLEEPSTAKKPRINEVEVEDIMDQDESAAVSISASALVPEPEQGEKDGVEPAESANDTGFKEPPYTYLPRDDPSVVACLEKLNINSSFPAHNLLVRNPTGEAARSMYLTNDLVRKIIGSNDYTRLRLVTAGTKIFGRQEGKSAGSSFRVLGDGIPVVMPYIADEHIVTADIEMLRVLMEGYYPLLTAFNQEFRRTLEIKSPGNHIVRFPAGDRDGVNLSHDLVVPIWKSGMSLGLMIDKKTKRSVNALSLRLFGRDITTVGQQKAKSQNENQARGDQTETPVEHAPMVEEGKEPTPVIGDDDNVPGEVEENSET